MRRGGRGPGRRGSSATHRGGVGGHGDVELRRRRARRRPQAARHADHPGAELLRVGHGRLPQRLPGRRLGRVRRRPGGRVREDAGRQLGRPNRIHPVVDYGERAPHVFALAANRYFAKYGASKKTLAKVAVKNHQNGLLSPKAHLDGDQRGDGAEGAADLQPARALRLLPDDRWRRCGRRVSRRPGQEFHADSRSTQGDRARGRLRPAVLQAEFRLREFAATRPPRQPSQGRDHAPTTSTSPRCTTASPSPRSSTTRTSILRSRRRRPFVEEGRAALGGEKPVNPSGGLKSFGHPVGATGVRMINELGDPAPGQAGDRQVKDAELGLAHNLGAPARFRASRS